MKEEFLSFVSSNVFLSELLLHRSGWHKCPFAHSYGPVIRSQYMIHYAVCGQGTLHNSCRSFTLEQGQGFLTFPNEEVTYVADKKMPWQYYWIGFSGSIATYMIESSGLSPNNPVFSLPDIDATARCLQSIYDSCSSTPYGEIQALGYLLLFLSMIVDINTNLQPKIKTRSPKEEYVAKALFILEKDNAVNVSVEALADLVGITRSHLFRAFKNVLSVSPKQYILEMRIQRACQLLSETQMSIDEIAQAVGFSTHSQMGVSFKKIMHVTPSSFRRQIRGLRGKVYTLPNTKK